MEKRAFKIQYYKLLFLALALLLFSCSKEYEETTKTITLPEFSQIEISHPFEIYLNETDSFALEITGDKTVVENIRYEVENDILYIKNLSNSQWTNPQHNIAILIISSKPLKKLTVKETSNTQTLTPITSDEFGLILESKANTANLELACNKFYFWNNFPCGGLLELRGTVQNLSLGNFAIMRVDASKLNATNANVNNYSKGDCNVNVTNKLEYSIHGLGDILLHGQPAEIINNGISSEGKLITLSD